MVKARFNLEAKRPPRPANSPDLNPIENVWNIIKVQTSKKYYKNVSEMKQEITTILSNISIAIINNIIDSMDNRIEELFNKNFENINY